MKHNVLKIFTRNRIVKKVCKMTVYNLKKECQDINQTATSDAIAVNLQNKTLASCAESHSEAPV